MVLGLEVKVFQSVEEIGKDSIDSISNDPFFTYGWLRTVETHLPFKISPLYIAVYDEKTLVAFGQFTIKTLKPSDIFPTLPKFLDRSGFGLKVLVSESPCCWRSNVLLLKNRDQKQVFSLLSKKIDDICKEEKIQYSNFSFVSQQDSLIIESLQSHGYVKHTALATLYLDVHWNSFQDYLESLKPKVRSNVRREIKKFAEKGIIIEGSELENLFEKLAELNSNLFLKYKNTGNIFDSAFFSKLNEHAKDKIKLFIAKKKNDVVGFSLSLRQKDVVDVVMVGFKYDIQTKTDFTYFNLAYYAPIQWAIEQDVKKMYYRIKQERVKINRGCKLDRNCCLIKWHNRRLGTLVDKIYYLLHDRDFRKRF